MVNKLIQLVWAVLQSFQYVIRKTAVTEYIIRKRCIPKTWNFVTKKVLKHVWNISAQPLYRKFRVAAFFFEYLVNKTGNSKKFYQSIYCKAFLKKPDGMSLIWKHPSFNAFKSCMKYFQINKKKIFYLRQICWKNQRQKLHKLLIPILKPLQVYRHRSKNADFFVY